MFVRFAAEKQKKGGFAAEKQIITMFQTEQTACF